MKRILDIGYVFPKIDVTIFNYPKWLHLVPEIPTEAEFNNAWLQKYEYPYLQCNVEFGEQFFYGNSLGSGFTIKTPKSIFFEGGICEYTDEPVLSEDQFFYYEGGCTWDTDLLGQRYLKINAGTLHPVNLSSCRNVMIIYRYLKQNPATLL